MISILPLLLALHIGVPTAAGANGSCPAQTTPGRRIATSFAGANAYSAVRARYDVASTTADQVRLLADATDAAACTALMQALVTQAQAAGGSLTGTTPEFYAVGTSYYFAVLPLPPSTCTPAPGSSCIDTRAQALTIFNRQFSVVASVRI